MKRITFDPKETDIIGYVPGYRPWMPPMPIFFHVVSPRDNFLAFLEGKDPLWMPSIWDYKRFDPRIIPDNVAKGMVSDNEPFDAVKDGGGKDWFGIEWTFDPKAGGALIHPDAHPVKDINNWEKYVTLPDLEIIDWEKCSLSNTNKLNDGRLTQMTIFSGLFERLMSFMGMTDAMVAMVDEDQQEGVHRLFNYLCGFYDRLFEKYRKYFGCDLIWFQDDWGSEKAPFCSPSTYREVVVPYLKRIVESCHKRGMYFEFHCCGKNEILVPLFIECGVDMWHGQAINDKEMLYKKFGQKIKLGISPEGYDKLDNSIPPMTNDESRIAFRQLLDTYNQGNVWIGTYMGASQDASNILYEESRKAYEKSYRR